MQHYKIVETGSKFPDVLIYRDRDDDGYELVKILAIGIIDGEENMFAIEQIAFEIAFTAMEYVECFSKLSAEKWCERQGITCWGKKQ